MRTKSRKGVSLVEVLVVVSVSATLAALLLPAVQQVRAAAARVDCQNRLRQQALGLHLHQETAGTLPAGMSPQDAREPMPLAGWATYLLPYLSQQPLWDQTVATYSLARDKVFSPPHPGLGTQVQLFSCPADPRTATPQRTHRGLIVGTSGYLGVSGTNYHTRDGVLYAGSRTRLVDVVDGTSATLAIGERPPSPDFWYGWWYAGTGQLNTGSCNSVLGSRELRVLSHPSVASCPVGPFHFKSGRSARYCDIFHFWSLHPGGANFAFCDGSVRFLRYEADAILPALATRAGGEVVQIPD